MRKEAFTLSSLKLNGRKFWDGMATPLGIEQREKRLLLV